ncbi:MAG TPA: DUF4402 domain-containing protein [Bacteroidales bacterium]|jgi:spore coat protein U-like protein|nr:DUF4402 domain-containing protein [Bacteroidales bacterium]HPH80644.1 DUF4402 domain-containing protein [Bacteroidales bacterium]HPH80645.1 DUF4402 domain-containing protein [Bacteroidales bacterium]HPK39860.1 DUF4402 domain-containing protein [Bacteroidales bacterium]HPK39861.1 DUF4402 domain-containing protein [Bacteroidales bacterium]
MKTTLKIFALSVALFGINNISFAQANTATQNANAGATIVTPISLVKNIDLNFGNIAAGASDFTVALSATGTRTSSGGIGTLPSVTGTVAAAKFTASGLAEAQYSVSLPASPITISAGSGKDMTVSGFVADTDDKVLTGGSDEFTVGATLNVKANQAAGAYTGTFNVTVAYE